MMNRRAFFEAIRNGIFKGSLKQSQVDALNVILDECLSRSLPIDSTAYVMATAYWEPGADMVPKEENLWYSTAERIRVVWPSRFPTIASAAPYAKNPKALAMKVYGNRSELGNLTAEDGWNFRGRGIVQLTGRANYQKAELQLGLPLVSNPDLLLDLATSVRVLVEGMQEGWFTGYDLEEARAVPGYVDDRKVVNGSNEARRIAGFAEAFEKALEAARYDPDAAAVPDALSEADIAAAAAIATWLEKAPANPRAIGEWLMTMPEVEA